MKPLPSAPLTDEDSDVWQLLQGGRDFNGAWHIWIVAAMEADRRDAALMFEAQRARSYTFPVDMPPLVLIGSSGNIDCGGNLPEWKTLNITYCA